MQKYSKLILIIMIFITLTNIVESYDFSKQFDSDSLQFGGYINFGFNFQNSDFKKLESFSFCCPNFSSGFGTGFSLGLLSTYKLNNKFIPEIRLGYKKINANFLEKQDLYLGIDDYPIQGFIEYEIESDLHYLNFEISTNYILTEKISVYSGLVFDFLLSNSYFQSENLSDGVFTDNGLNYRNRYNENLDKLSYFLPQLKFGFNYKYKNTIFQQFEFYPEFSFNLPLNSTHQESAWYNIPFQFGLSIRYHPTKDTLIEYEFETLQKIDTIEVMSFEAMVDSVILGVVNTETDTIDTEIIRTIVTRTDTLVKNKKWNLSAELKTVGITDSSENDEFNMIVKEVSYFNMTPLLTYVFFDYDSDILPNRYKLLTKEEVKSFNIRDLYSLETLELYQHILNIIGFRLKMNPNTNITLTGCNTDAGKEKFDLSLSKARANAVKNYLIKIWEIPDSNIIVKARNLPKNYSFRDTPEGKEENQRVEISSDFYSIIAPIIINDTIRTTTPKMIRFYPKAKAEAGIKEWTVFASQNNKILTTISGYDTIPNSINWNIDRMKETIPKFNSPLLSYLEITDSLGNKFKSKLDTIKLTQHKVEKSLNIVGNNIVEKFSLILFDFDNVKLNKYNQKIKDYINSRLSPNFTVYISGYTDKLGDETYNQYLSESRAKALANSLGISEDNAKGFGESILLYDNSLPEGRFYCRTVEVIVETPFEKNGSGKK